MKFFSFFSLFFCCFLYPAFPEDQRSFSLEGNSFLLEEAYNQQPGIVQHINSFRRSDKNNWIYMFTEEWPVFGERHQFSVSVPVISNGEHSSGWGDLFLNYRYQLTGDEKSNIAVAPRVSLVLPTGNEKEDRGAGGVGVQTNFPISAVLHRKLVTHFNVGFTYTNSARNEKEEIASTVSARVGQSWIYQPSSHFHLLFEVVWENREIVSGKSEIDHEYSFYLNPGIRWAHHFSKGLLVVPGISLPVGAGPSGGDVGIFLYLSLQHPFTR